MLVKIDAGLPREGNVLSRLESHRRIPAHLFILILFANAFFSEIERSINSNGLVWALSATFEISIIKWFAMWFVFKCFESGEIVLRDSLDWAVLLFVAFCVCVPLSGMTWVGASMASVYFLLRKRHDENGRRGLWVLFALSFSGLWSKIIARIFMEYILYVDTILVAGLTGTAADANLISAADGVTTLVVTEGCSSFSNLSLAFLGWIVARSWYGTRGVLRSTIFVTLAGSAVVLINTIRIGIIALWPSAYDIAHGPVGANIASVATTIAVGLLAYAGAKR